MTLNIDGPTIFRAVVHQLIPFNPIAIASEAFAAFGPEKKQSDIFAASDCVVGDEIVDVMMADGNPDVIAGDEVLFGDAVADSPAEENADVIIEESVASHHGAL